MLKYSQNYNGNFFAKVQNLHMEIPNDDENKWAMAMHLSFLLGFPLPFIGYILAPLAVYLLAGKDKNGLGLHFREIANFFITWCVIPAAFGILYWLFVILTLGIGGLLTFPLAVLAGILWVPFVVVFPVIASIKALNGETYRYPMTIRFLKVMS